MLVGLLCLAGCATAPRAGVAPEGMPEFGDASGVTGTWRGSYVCAQGLTALELELTGQADGRVEGTFAFSEHPDNPGVPSGSYRVHGRMSASGILTLRTGEWIVHPQDYFTVAMVGRVELAPDRFYGFIDGAGCDTFLVER